MILRNLKFLTVLALIFPISAFYQSKSRHNIAKRSTRENYMLCLGCNFYVAGVVDTVNNPAATDENVMKALGILCTSYNPDMSPVVCAGILNNMKDVIVGMIQDKSYGAKELCSLINYGICNFDSNPWDLVPWSVEIPAQLEVLPAAQPMPKKLNILHVTDIHLDLKYQPGTTAFCSEPLCCHADSSSISPSEADAEYAADLYEILGSQMPENIAEANQYFTSHTRNCNIPVKFFNVFLKTVKKLHQKKPIDAIYWTGDLAPHNIWETGKDHNLIKLYKKFGKILSKQLKKFKIPIYFSLGNHDTIKAVNYYSINEAQTRANRAILKSMKNHIKLNKFQSKKFAKYGFYSQDLNAGLKIVTINSNFGYIENFQLLTDLESTADVGGMLKWLIKELLLAEQNGQKVHILGHISPAQSNPQHAKTCSKTWSENYHKIVTRFSHVITGQFFGHLHTDLGLQVMLNKDPINSENRDQFLKALKGMNKNITDQEKIKNLKKVEAINNFVVSPSLTTFDGGLPGFKLLKTNMYGDLINFADYFVNNASGNEIPKFVKTFEFRQKFEKEIKKSGLNLEDNYATKAVSQIFYNHLVDVYFSSDQEYFDYVDKKYRQYLGNSMLLSTGNCPEEKCRQDEICEHLESKVLDEDPCILRGD